MSVAGGSSATEGKSQKLWWRVGEFKHVDRSMVQTKGKGREIYHRAQDDLKSSTSDHLSSQTNSNVADDIRSRAQGSSGTQKVPDPKDINAWPVRCWDWKVGKCLRGDKCPFLHEDEPSEVMSSDTQKSDQQVLEGLNEPNWRARRLKGEEGPKESFAEELKARGAEGTRERERERHREEGRRAELERQLREAQENERLAREAKWREEAAVVEQYVVFDTSLIACGAGLAIQNIIPGFDLCKLTIKNLPRDTRHAEIANIFLQQGLSTSDFFLAGNKVIRNAVEAVVLANAEQGQVIATGLDGIEFRDKVLKFEVVNYATSDLPDQSQAPCMIVSWQSKNLSRGVIVSYHSADEAHGRAHELNGRTWDGNQIGAVINEWGFAIATATSVKITNCPPNAHCNLGFRKFVGGHSILPLDNSYDHRYSLRTVRTHLSQQKGVRMGTYEVLTSGNIADETRVKVAFDHWDNVQRAYKATHDKLLGDAMLIPTVKAFYPRPRQIVIPRRQYLAQKSLWDAIEERGGEGASLQIREGDWGDVFIHVLGIHDDKKAAGALKVRVESLLAGQALDTDHWHPSFLSDYPAKPFFDRIYDNTGAYVRTDFKARSLRVYAEPGAIEEACRQIKAEVERLNSIETTKFIDRAAVGFFVREGLGRLKELIGEADVKLNLAVRPCMISIKGGEGARRHLQRLIEEAGARSSESIASESQTRIDQDTCPVCYTATSNPEQLGCGHNYCAGCLQHYLSSVADNKTFPLLCIGSDGTCNTPISIPFIKRFIPVQTFQNLVEVAFTQFLDRHPQEYGYCKTPDCRQVYRRQTEPGMVLQCPSCFSTICSACGEESHPGLTCQESRLERDPAEQEKMHEQLGLRRCPQCNAWIEKNGGCNHVACKCGAHICWRCMGVFDNNEIYAHMVQSHGDIFDEHEVPALDPVQLRHMIAEHILAQGEHFRVMAENRRARAEQRRRERERRTRELEEARQRRAEIWAQLQHEREADRQRERQLAIEQWARLEREPFPAFDIGQQENRGRLRQQQEVGQARQYWYWIAILIAVVLMSQL